MAFDTPQKHYVPVIHRRPKAEPSEQARVKTSAMKAARDAAKRAGVPLIDLVSQGVYELAASVLQPVKIEGREERPITVREARQRAGRASR